MFSVFFGMRGVRARSCGWARGPGSIWGGLALLWQNPVGKSRRFIASSAHVHVEGFDPCDVGLRRGLSGLGGIGLGKVGYVGKVKYLK